MSTFTPFFRRKGRPRPPAGPTRKRPGRSFASTFALLEGRALLSTVGPVPVTTPSLSSTTLALIQSTPALSGPIAPLPFGGGGGGGPSPHDGGPQGSSDPGQASNRGTSRVVQPGDHVGMDVAQVTVDGQSTREIALADFDQSRVVVRDGPGTSPIVLGPVQGVDHPYAVTLADLNGDGVPDLIVANTNGNNVLVFPGLAEGQFGAGQAYSVGLDPASVTVDRVGGPTGQVELLVTNAGSDTVSILSGASGGALWTPTMFGSVATQDVPIRALLYDVSRDGTPDLLVCNFGSGSVTVYQGLGDGSFANLPVAVLPVGVGPDEIFVGQFDRHPGPDLVAIDSGSDSLTIIGDVFGPEPTTQTISSGGTSPDAAVAIDPTHSGVLDLVVANGGDGHLSIFRGGNDGLQLAGVITQAGVSSPTALSSTSSGGDEISFLAAGAGADAALLLSFDLGVASTFLPGTSEAVVGAGATDEELFAQLMSNGDSSLDLVAVFWAGEGDLESTSDVPGLRESSAITVAYSPTEGQGVEALPAISPADPTATAPPSAPVEPFRGDESAWARFVLGTEAALGRPSGFTEAVAARDSLDEPVDRPMQGLVRLEFDRRGSDRTRDLDAGSQAVDEALRMYLFDGSPRAAEPPLESPPRTRPDVLPGGDEAPSVEGQLETVPLISAVAVISTRVILRASTPRPPSFRGKAGARRFVSPGHDRSAEDPTEPV